jgi:hypothetical protein
MSLPELHNFLAIMISLFTMGVSLLALYRFLRNEGLGSDFWGTVVIGEILIIVQAILGGVLYGMGVRPYEAWHYMYGALAIGTWPAAYSFTHDAEGKRQAGIWLAVSLFLFLMITWRGRTTGALPPA